MNYKTFNPSQTLNAFVKCYWTLEGPIEQEPAKERILPDGCMEMIFHYGNLYRQYNLSGNFIIQPRCLVFGQVISPLEIQPTGSTGIFAVRFYPEAFAPFAKIPARSMNDRAVPLEEVFGNEGITLEKEILCADTTEQRIKRIEDFLLNTVSRGESVDRIVRSSVALILDLKGQLPISTLSRQLPLSRRQLERRFSAATGLSPKQLSKIVRLQTSLKMLAEGLFSHLGDVAYDNDFYDQSHFINDFKEFTGLSPKEYYADSLRMATLFLGLE